MQNTKTLSNEKNRLYRELELTKILLRSVPSSLVALFVTGVVAMNLLANKTIYQSPYLALDGGILISWLSFMSMDIITKHFGPKAANRISIFAVLVNLLFCFLFYLVSIIPSSADDYTAFNTIFGGTWFILLGSTLAFISSSFINNHLNYAIYKLFKKESDERLVFMARSYLSTFVGQFVDNLVFAIIVFMIFAPIYWDGFSWTLLQSVTCALSGALLELVMEVLFSPLAYKVTKNWEKEGVGQAYFDYLEDKKCAF